MGRLLVFITIAYLSGIILGRYLFTPGTAFFILIFAFIWFLVNLFVKRSGVLNPLPLLPVFLAAGILACCFAMQKTEGNIREFAGEKCLLTGMVEDEPLWREDDAVFLLRSEKVLLEGVEYEAAGTVRVTLRLDEAGKAAGEESGGGLPAFLSYGQQISMQGTVNVPAEQRNPGGFDYRSYLETQGAAAVFYGSASGIASLGVSESLSLLRRSAIQLRQRIAGILGAYMPQRESGLLIGMLFGDSAKLDTATTLYFRRCGVSHLLAVSGLHTGLVAAFILFILKRSGLGKNNRLLFFLTVLLLFCYVYLTGLKPSALRAFFMISTGLLAYCLEREQDLSVTLAAACLLTLLYNPLLLFSVGFQLSYGATAAIIILALRWQKSFNALLDRPVFASLPFTRQLSSLAAVTFAAQFGVLPLGAWYFSQVSLVAFLVNLVLLPIMSFVLGIGLFAALIGLLLPAAGSFLALSAYPLLAYMAWITKFMGAVRFAVLELFPPRIWEICLYYLLLFSPVMISRFFPHIFPGQLFEGEGQGEEDIAFPSPSDIKHTKLFRGAAALSITLLLLVWCGFGIHFPGQLEVVFLDVGQGDSIYIQTPAGKSILLDAGGKPSYSLSSADPGERVLIPFLQYKRIRKLDAVIVSHPHEDHFAGFAAVLEKTPVRLMLTNASQGDTELYSSLLESALGKNIPREIIKAGDRVVLEPSLEMRVLSPPDRLFSGTDSDENNNSLLLQLVYKDISFLFAGDLESAAVSTLLREDPPMRSQVIKIPHHGADLPEAPDLLEHVNPAAAVLTVGKNSFGHPHPATLAALEEKNIKIYRTDQHGAITMRTNGRKLTVKTHLP